MKTIVRLLISLAFPVTGLADPQLSSWFTVHSSEAARVYRNDAERGAGQPEMTWGNGHQTQAQRLVDQIVGLRAHLQRTRIQKPLRISVPPPAAPSQSM